MGSWHFTAETMLRFDGEAMKLLIPSYSYCERIIYFSGWSSVEPVIFHWQIGTGC